MNSVVSPISKQSNICSAFTVLLSLYLRSFVDLSRSENPDFIKEYSAKLVELEEKLVHAKANINLIEDRAEATA